MLFGSSPVQSEGYNICNTGCGGFLNGPGDQLNADPRLDPSGLNDNGGPTRTIALLPESPAINSGNDASAPSRDQRHYARADRSDIGAFEHNGAPTAVPLLSAVSRKQHQGAGIYDVVLPLNGSVAIECRSGGSAAIHTIIFNFQNALANVAGATVSGSNARVAHSGIGSDRREYIVTLSEVADAQQITLTLSDIIDSSENFTESVSLNVGFLLGDTTGNGTVNASDIGETKAQSGQPANTANVRQDLNASGQISASDIGIVKSQAGSSLPSSRVDATDCPDDAER
jgi:hypothetical protein